MSRIIIVGGPRRGKSTLAATLGNPVFCGDPRSKVKEPLDGVTYLPEGLPFSGDGGGADWIAANWFTMRGPWTCEGHAMARALRRWAAAHKTPPCDRIIILDREGFNYPTARQDGMHDGVMKVWGEIAHLFRNVAQQRLT